MVSALTKVKLGKEVVRACPHPLSGMEVNVLRLREIDFASIREYGDYLRKSYENFLDGCDESYLGVCRWCGGNVWWLRESGARVCSRCHPEPV